MNQKELIQRKQELREYFWDANNLDFPDKKVLNQYQENFKDWTKFAGNLRESFPKEVGVYLSRYFNSPFFYKMGMDELSLFGKKKRFTPTEKIQIIKDVFENGYHHFGLLTVASNFSKKFIESLYVEWYNPYKARGYHNSRKVSQWYSKRKTIISGKEWILENCPLYNNASFDPLIIKDLRNADSHGQAVQQKDEIVFLTKNRTVVRRLTKKEINSMFNFVVSAIRCSFHFNFHLFLNQKFWLTTSLMWLVPGLNKKDETGLFVFSQDGLQINTKNIKRENNDRRNYTNSVETDFDNRGLYISIVFDFVFIEVWNILETDKDQINNFLKAFGLAFDYNHFKEVYAGKRIEMYNRAISELDKLDENRQTKKSNLPSLNEGSIDSFDISKHFLFVYHDWYRVNKSKISKGPRGSSLIMILSMMTIVLDPATVFVKCLKDSFRTCK